MAKWVLKENDANIELMSKVLGISEITSYVLANRDIRTKNTAKRYLTPKDSNFFNMDTMKDVNKAFEIIKSCKNKNQKITIYGDYDVDGVMSTTILTKALKEYGCNVSYYIPDREKEGYGLNISAVKEIKNDGTDLLLTCDNGIASLEEIKLAKELGLMVIVLDHHEPGFVEDEEGNRIDVIPVADAVIDPKQKSCEYPFKEMCAAGISYKFMRAFYESQNLQFDSDYEYIIFAAIATFCDVVALKEENRIIAKNGLYYMNNCPIKNIGLLALMKEKSILEKNKGSFDMGFIIGPCINATGRLGSATMAVELFLTQSDEKALELSKALSDLNEERKAITNKAVEKTIDYLLEDLKRITPVIVIYDNEIHESIAGIVAGRVKDSFFHPAIVLTDGDGYVKGSARSIEAYNIFENLFENRDLFLRFGGHAMAAGLSLKKENIDVLRNRLNENCTLKREDFTEIINIDKKLDISEVTYNLAEELLIMEPFGKSNKEPLFVSEKVKLDELRLIEEKNTIIFTFSISDTYRKIKGICFGKVDDFKEIIYNFYGDENAHSILSGKVKDADIYLDIVYSISINEYNNTVSVQLKLKDFKLSI